MNDSVMAKLNNTRVRIPTHLAVDEANSQSESYDVSTLNPPGRVTTEGGSNSERRFLKCKEVINISTMNVRTLRNSHKQLEL